MANSERESYLKGNWQGYPSVPSGTWTLKKVAQNSNSPFPQPLRLAGKVMHLDPSADTLLLGAQGESWKIHALGDWPFPGLNGLIQEGRGFIEPGDCLWIELNQAQWSCADKGELSGQVHQMLLLAPNVEERPSRFQYWAISEKWAQFLTQVRAYFTANRCQEVWTPSLVPCPGMEPTLDPFEVELGATQGARKTFFLSTSPELHLKKLLVSGGGDLFEIKECFRNGEVSDHHQPEFWMLEWYRTYADLEVIIEDIQGLLNHLVEWQVFPQQDILLKQVTMKELFQRFLDFDLQPDTDRRQLLQECGKWQIPVTGDELWNDLFHLLFLIKIEPLLSEMGPLVVKDFPPSQAALARLTESGWVDRFEFYWQGLEIANAFNELNDPEEQLRRCYRDNREREDRGRRPLPLDTDFIQALKNGMPPSGGIALGLERFFMAGLGYHDIREIRPFSIEDSRYSFS